MENLQYKHQTRRFLHLNFRTQLCDLVFMIYFIYYFFFLIIHEKHAENLQKCVLKIVNINYVGT